MTPMLLAVALIAFTGPNAPVEDPSPAVGHWLGVLKLGPAELTLVLHVEQGDDGALSATLDSPDQSAFGMEVETVALEGKTLRFESPKINASFEGTLAEDGQTIDGTFTQRGKTPLKLTRTDEADLPRPVEVPEELLGLWEGPIQLPGDQELRVALRVEADADRPAKRTAVFDSLDQGVKGLPITAISVEGEAVRFEVKSIGGTFEGTFDEARTTIAGSWSQAGQDFPLTFSKVEQLSERPRPQHPEAPFPYRVEELTFENPEAGVTLAGTLTTPEGEGPFPAAVLVSGSGPQDRDETLLGHKPFLVLADHLTRSGIAVLRYDDRGVGGSTGAFGDASSADFAADALAAVRVLRGRPEVDPGAVGIVGHSEGGLVGPMAAVRAPEEVGFLVLLAGTGVPGTQILLHQTGLIARASGAPEAATRAQVGALETIIGLIEEDRIDEIGREGLDDLIRKTTAALGPEEREAVAESDSALADTAAQAVEQLRGPWFRYFLAHDPAPVLRQVDCPVLALFGEKDLQVDPSQNLGPVRDALEAGGNDRAEVEVLPGLNHLFQHAKTGSPTEYAAIEETFAPEALDRVSSWIRATTGRE